MSYISLTDEDHIAYLNFCRTSAQFLDKFDRYECQELLSTVSTHCLLASDFFKTSILPVPGLASSLVMPDNLALILFPVADGCPPFCYREIHTIVRELTLGIYVFNQLPSISLEASFDEATVCNIPPAYLDTRLGQLLANVDYMIKALWHGAYFPREKRIKFTERWREMLDVNFQGKAETKKPLLAEFQSAGLVDIASDPVYAHVYDQSPMEIPDDLEVAEERQFFLNNVDKLTMQMMFTQQTVQFYKNMFIVDAKYQVSSIVRILNNFIKYSEYERLKTRLQVHENLIQEHLAAQPDVHRQLEVLRLVSFLVPFLCGMRKKMKIPDLNKLLQPFKSDTCRTEREFPPLMLSQDFKCKNFKIYEKYFHLHGGISFDLETDEMQQAPQEFVEQYSDLMSVGKKELKEAFYKVYLDQLDKETYPIPECTINNQKYYAIIIDFETYYSMSPQWPVWVRAFCDELDKMKLSRLPVTEIQIHEQLKKNFGHKKALKYKVPGVGLKICVQRGLLAIFNALSRKVTSSKVGLNSPDEKGIMLIHSAATYNRPYILGRLLQKHVDVNITKGSFMNQKSNASSKFTLVREPRSYSVVRSSSYDEASSAQLGPTALHLAAQFGSLECVTCLLSHKANVVAIDDEGWTPIHRAAFFDQGLVVKLLVRRNPELLDRHTSNDLRSTPILLAATAGALTVVKCLVELGAELRITDSKLNGVIALAALHFHTNLLEYLIQLNNPHVLVWNQLVEMIMDEDLLKKDCSIKCMETLSSLKPNYWKPILEAKAIPALVSSLDLENNEMRCMAISTLCNISLHPEVRETLTEAGAVAPLCKLLSSPSPDIHSRAAIILADIATLGDNQKEIARRQGLRQLVALFDSDHEDVLINAVNAVRVLCTNHRDNQKLLAKYGGLSTLVEFIHLSSSDLQAGASAALAAAVDKNPENQDFTLSIGGGKPLVELLKCSRSVTVQLKAARAAEAMASNNIKCQEGFLDLDAPKALIRLLKNNHVQVREQGACTLWALAGSTRFQQRYIADRVSVPHIIQMLLEQTEKLIYIGCMMAIAYGIENITNQNQLCNAEIFSQLVRLLRSPKTSQKILFMAVKVIGVLCMGVAHKNNSVTQLKVVEEEGLKNLVQLLKNPPSPEIQVEVAITLGCLTLSCRPNQEKLQQEEGFSLDLVLALFQLKDPDLLLRAAHALTLVAFNNTTQQKIIRQTGLVKYRWFARFIESPDEFYQCYGAFQTIVLARVLVDRDEVSLTAHGVEILISKISSSDKVAALACSLISSLVHMRAGLSNAMVSVGVLDLLVAKLDSVDDLVRNKAATALGFLTVNRTAHRLLFSICRNKPDVYHSILKNMETEGEISNLFIEDFQRAVAVGLPSQMMRLEGLTGLTREIKQAKHSKAFGTSKTNLLGHRAMSAPSRVGSLLQKKSSTDSNRSHSHFGPSQNVSRNKNSDLAKPDIFVHPSYIQQDDSGDHVRPRSTSTSLNGNITRSLSNLNLRKLND